MALGSTSTRGKHSPTWAETARAESGDGMDFLGRGRQPLNIRLEGILQYLGSWGGDNLLIFDSPPLSDYTGLLIAGSVHCR